MLRISTQRLQAMERTSPWWTSDLRTEKGYDVVAIAVAQLQYSDNSHASLPDGEKDSLKARQLRAEVARAEHLAKEAEVKSWRAQRDREEEQGNILPADVYSQFVRELLGMLRSRLGDLPYQLSRQATPSQRKLVYVPEDKQKKASDAAPLQKMVLKLQSDIEEWLETNPAGEEGDE